MKIDNPFRQHSVSGSRTGLVPFGCKPLPAFIKQQMSSGFSGRARSDRLRVGPVLHGMMKRIQPIPIYKKP